MARTVIKTDKFEVRANFEHRIVSMIFEDREGNEADIWLGDGTIFLVLDKVREFLADHPEIEDWKIPSKYRPN